MMNDPWLKVSRIPRSIDQYTVLICRLVLNNYKEYSIEPMISNSLSSEEKRRMRAFKYEKDRIIYAVARYSTRLICSNLLNTTNSFLHLSLSNYGKPYLKDFDNLHFSISHSGNLILLGFGLHYPLGVDVELCNPSINYLEISQSVFSTNEIENLKKQKNQKIMEGFYNCWTKKESYIKAKGLGLSMALDSFTVNLFNDGKYNLIEAKGGQREIEQWQVFNFPVADSYKAACSCHRSIANIKYIDITGPIFSRLNNKR